MKVGRCGRVTIVTADAFVQLALIAEISATFLGFIAVFLILSDKGGGFMNPTDTSCRHWF
jgi:hypothetical protein